MHQILLAREGDRLFGDDPASLNLGERDLHGPGGFFDLCIERAAGQEAQDRQGGGDGTHDADDEPADPGCVRQERQQHKHGDDKRGRSQEDPRQCRIRACGQSIRVEHVLVEAPLCGGILFTHSIIILRGITPTKPTHPTGHYVR